jgi:Ni/Fe-hydrogenase subunit HybB-like protein
MSDRRTNEAVEPVAPDEVMDFPRKVSPWWLAAVGVNALLVALFVFAIVRLFVAGAGVWSVNQPVGWGMQISTFAWWIGVAHAATFVSAGLLLIRHDWNTGIGRFGEALALFTLASAGLFPIIHLGRPAVFYWLFPYPDTMNLWPQFRSSLTWDAFVLLAYAVLSLMIWYLGLLPDLASMRDRTRRRFARYAYGLLALGWYGGIRQWSLQKAAVLLLSGLAIPLVAIHAAGSFNFAISIVPGWHTTLLPPFFLASSFMGGTAVLLAIIIPARRWLDMEGIVRSRHLDLLARTLLISSLLVVYGHIVNIFDAWYDTDPYTEYLWIDRLPDRYWIVALATIAVAQLLWKQSLRMRAVPLFFISLTIAFGMWAERFFLVTRSLEREYIPAMWRFLHPTVWDWLSLAGSLALILLLALFFVRFVPTVSLAELREDQAERKKAGANASPPRLEPAKEIPR